MKKQLALLLLCICYAFQLSANNTYNFDFEYVTQAGEPQMWINAFGKKQGQFILDVSTAYSGKNSMQLINPNSESEASVGQYFPNKIFTGKHKMTLTAFVKGEMAALSQFSLNAKLIGMDSMYQRKPVAEKGEDWQKLEIECNLDSLKQGKQILVFCHLEGIGRVWVDKFTMTIDGAEVIDNQPVAALDWLNQRALPINSVTGNDWRDLRPLSKFIADKRIVALGEGTHGTKEFNEVRARLIHYLVEQENFDYIVMEDQVVRAEYLNNYIVDGKDNAKKWLKSSLMGVWVCPEMVEFLEILKKHNDTHAKKVKFLGMDMQYIEPVCDALGDLARRNNQDSLQQFAYNFRVAYAAKSDSLKKLIMPDLQAYVVRSAAKFSAEDTSLLFFYTRVLSQHTGLNAQLRDKFMAENMEWYANKYPQAKFIIWAHNGHIQRGDARMGAFLSSKFRKQYFAIGTFTAEGTYNSPSHAKGIQPFYDLKTPEKQHFEYYLAQLTPPQYFLPHGQFEDIPHEMRQIKQARGIGAVGGDSVRQFYAQYPLNYFDASIFLKKTQATTYLWRQ